MTTIDYEGLRHYADFFSELVNKASYHLDTIFPNQTVYDFQSGVNFHAGFILMEEGYKYAAVRKYGQYLHPMSWNDSSIKSGIVSKEVLALVYDDELDNLIDWRDKDWLKKQMGEESKRIMIGDCFRDIFRGDDDKVSFQHARNVIGDRFPILSYLYFIKEPDKYLPVRPDAFSKRFRDIGISEWKRVCNWENYMDFISTIENVQLFIMEYFQDESISLLDAHSFVWMAWMLKMSEAELFILLEDHCKIALGEGSGKSNTQEDLAEKARRIEAELSDLKGEEKEAVIKLRVNQRVFRNLLLDRYKSCCLCKVSNRNLLSASHIKPWSISTADEKLDRDNGFLMCPNHDRLFDKGYISFDNDGGIVISDNLSEIDRVFTNVNSNMSIELTEGNKKYLRYHRDVVFKIR